MLSMITLNHHECWTMISHLDHHVNCNDISSLYLLNSVYYHRYYNISAWILNSKSYTIGINDYYWSLLFTTLIRRSCTQLDWWGACVPAGEHRVASLRQSPSQGHLQAWLPLGEKLHHFKQNPIGKTMKFHLTKTFNNVYWVVCYQVHQVA